MVCLLSFSCEKRIFRFIDCAIISNNGEEPRIFEVNTTATLIWNLDSVPGGIVIYFIYYYKNNNKVNILHRTLTANTFDEQIGYAPINNPFEENRINAVSYTHLTLPTKA